MKGNGEMVRERCVKEERDVYIVPLVLIHLAKFASQILFIDVCGKISQ